MTKLSRIKLMLAVAPLLSATHLLAATVTANPGDNLQARVDAAANGTLVLGAGTFNIAAPLNIHAGTTIHGADHFASHLIFNLQPNDLTQYALLLDANASTVTLGGLDIVSNRGVVGMYSGQSFSNIVITGNQLQYGGGTASSGVQIEGIYCTVSNTATQITYNYFHDSPGSNRNWEVSFSKNSHFDHNLFYNINDGGHLWDPVNTTFSYNYGTRIHRMGQEIQCFNATTANESNFIADHDVFYDYIDPYFDTEGMSVCPASVTGVQITNCYVRTSRAPGSGWGPADGHHGEGGVHRFGFAIESMAPGLLCANDTLVLGPSTYEGIASGMSTTVNNCTVYGATNALFGVWGGDYGPNGKIGTFNLGAGALANTVNNELTNAPPPPSNTFAGPQFLGGDSDGGVPRGQPTPPVAPPVHTIETFPDGSISVDGARK